MIIETTINLKNKSKEELILLLNESLGVIEKLQKENKELKEDRDKFKKELLKRITYCNELEKDLFENGSNYVIPIQKVKDNLIKYQEEYELLLEHQSGKESNRTKYLRGRIHMCQELLESEE